MEINKNETIVITTAIVCIAALIISKMYYGYKIDKAAIAKGMIETTTPGNAIIVWQYPKGEK